LNWWASTSPEWATSTESPLRLSFDGFGWLLGALTKGR
jgi:hypothetical protein